MICACVRLEEGSNVTEQKLRIYSEEVHNDKPRMFTVLPTYYTFMKQFSETTSGKISRRELTNLATEKFKENYIS